MLSSRISWAQMSRVVSSPSLLTDFCSFLDQGVSPFHATAEVGRRLLASGFTQLSERDPSFDASLHKGGKYFYTRNESTILAFCVGGQYESGEGFHIIGAHTDSPCLKVKPVSNCVSEGCAQLGVQTYGGGLWHTWFDRDLTIAGRVLVKNGEHVISKLAKIPGPVCRVPTLAIHLDRSVNTDGFNPNTQNHLLPILSLQLEGESKPLGKHHPLLLSALAAQCQCDEASIVDFDLSLCDTQLATVGGIKNDFVFSSRLDNLASCFTSLSAFLGASGQESSRNVRAICFFDHEEIGSNSAYGAASNMLQQLIRRVTASLGGNQSQQETALLRSMCISADMAHACHPNYASKHEPNHRPRINGGVVIKNNANQRYATTSVTGSFLRDIAAKQGVPIQDFVVPNDSACGSTIGPIISTACGMRTVDVGQPQLSMHSIREMCGTEDCAYAIELYKGFFETFAELDRSWFSSPV